MLGGRVKLVPGRPGARPHGWAWSPGARGARSAPRRGRGLDAFITGEGAHHNFFDAEEGGINLYLGGHYATEMWGVRALARHLEEKFGLPWSFIDHPTGL